MVNGYSARMILPVIRDMNPVMDDWVWEVVRDGRFRRATSFTSDFTFIGEDYGFIFVLGNLDPCATITMEISRYGVVVDTVDLLPASGEYTTHSVTLSPIAIDEFATLKSGWETKYNMLELPDSVTVRPSAPIGTISTAVTCTSNTFEVSTACLPDAIGWTLVQVYRVETEDLDIAASYAVTTEATYQREEFSGAAAPGPDWLSVGGTLYARPLTIAGSREQYDQNFDQATNESEVIFRQTFFPLGFSNQAANFATADNGRYLSDVLDKLALDLGFTVRSEVLSINALGTTVTGGPYDHLPDYANILLFQKTDITKVDATQNATKAEITLKETLELLESWNLQWYMEGTVLRIEHPAFFTQTLGPVDFDVQRNAGLDGYNYDDVADIAFLDYNWQDETDNSFDGTPIQYTCGGTKTEEINAGRFTSNVTYMLSQPDKINKDGFAIVATTPVSATEATYIVDQGLGGVSYLNSPLSWPVIAERFFLHDSPAPFGVINGNSVTFATTRPLKKSQELNLPIEDFFAFNPDELVNTPIGEAEIDKATYSGRAQTITVETLAQ